MSVVAIVLIASGCGTNFSRNRAARTDDPSRTDPPATEQIRRTPSATTAAPKPATGSLELQLFDEHDLHPSGIPVEIGDKTLTSDEDGKVVFTARPGEYTARVVAGCHREVEIVSGGTASFRLVGNRVTSGRLIARWRHRYGPSQPVHRSIVGDWEIGQRVEITYAVFDKCRDVRAPNVEFDWFSFARSSTLLFDGTPSMRSDDKGDARVTVACQRSGAVGLELRDEDDPSATFDLFRFQTDAGDPPRCVQQPG